MINLVVKLNSEYKCCVAFLLLSLFKNSNKNENKNLTKIK